MAKKFANDILESPQKVLDAVRGGEIDPNAKEVGIPILAAAISNDDLILAAELIERGADVNAYAGRPAAERGMAPIHFAKSPGAVELLSKAKADIDAPFKSVDRAWGMRGETALHSAAISGNRKLFEALKSAGGDVNKPFSKVEYDYSAASVESAESRVVRGGLVPQKMLERQSVDPAALKTVAEKRARENAEVLAELSNNKIELVVGPEKQVSAAANSWASKAKPKANETELPGAEGQNDNRVESDSMFKPSAKQAELPLPESVKKYYLQVGKKFYQPNNKDLVAFEDRGSELHTKSDSPNVVKSLVAIAAARGWDEIKSSGSEAFRRAAWFEAAKLGINDRGYKPTELDLAELAKMKVASKNKIEEVAEQVKFRGGENANAAKPATTINVLNSDAHFKALSDALASGKVDAKTAPATEKAEPKMEPVPATEPAPTTGSAASAKAANSEVTQAAAPAKNGLDAANERHARQEQAIQEAIAKAAARRAEREAAANQTVVDPVKAKSEVLIDHGPAPYKHDKDNSDSYFVTTLDQDGKEKTRWGVDLERAVKEAGANIGDKINLSREHDKDVVVEGNKRDETGKVIGKEIVETIRNKWNIEVAEALRSEDIEKAVEKYPQLAGAAAVLAASEKHASELDPAQRKAVLNMVRENIAKNIENGNIPSVQIREEREINNQRAKAQQRDNQEQERSI